MSEVTITAVAQPSFRGIKYLAPQSLHAHPQNPRVLRQDVVETIAKALRDAGYFHESHAPLAYYRGGDIVILRGHHRVEAARVAGLPEIPVYVEAFTEDEALEHLVYGNAQAEMSNLEHGLASLVIEPAPGQAGKGLSTYATRVGIQPPNLSKYRRGAEVFLAVRAQGTSDDVIRACRQRAEHLAVIGANTEPSMWRELVEHCVLERWSLRKTREHVAAPTPVDGAQVVAASMMSPSDESNRTVGAEHVDDKESKDCISEGTGEFCVQPPVTDEERTVDGQERAGVDGVAETAAEVPNAAGRNAPEGDRGSLAQGAGAVRAMDDEVRALLRARSDGWRRLRAALRPMDEGLLRIMLSTMEDEQNDQDLELAIDRLLARTSLVARARELARHCKRFYSDKSFASQARRLKALESKLLRAAVSDELEEDEVQSLSEKLVSLIENAAAPTNDSNQFGSKESANARA